MLLNSPPSVKTVLTGKGPLGGGRLGVPGVGTRDPRHGLGGPYTRKKFSGPRSKYTHSGHSTSFDPLCDIPSGCCSFTGPWTVTRSSLRMLRRVATFCRPLRPVLLLVSFPRSRSPVVGVLPPPPPKGVPRYGGGAYGGQNPKNHGGIIFGPKMMIFQGVRRQKPYVGVCYANDLQKRGIYDARACA